MRARARARARAWEKVRVRGQDNTGRSEGVSRALAHIWLITPVTAVLVLPSSTDSTMSRVTRFELRAYPGNVKTGAVSGPRGGGGGAEGRR